ncbi:hypothetical protein BG842_05345 [Haladaptatus sp. W1]|uniref:PQQ-binding-like beta-propeller repeat protein n=1 Tax=Haladaptatus sp. W1 TaxID=1897478 RepID=UPI000849E872|nr:PQQ-binding-like beta-propeller repeat protein [Haladaptatus sp. W1]ODR81257.1 hypothetical protein BG842_05345 [Haladaptatus sp. W1]
MAAVEPVISDETLFLAVTTQNGPTSGRGYAAAYDPETGEELWKQTGLPAPRTPVVDDGILYITTFLYEDSTEGGLFAFDTDTGELLWRRSEHLEWADPILVNGQLFTESDGGVYALDPTTGTVNWKRDDVTGKIGYRDWHIHFVDGSIYLGDGTALNAEDGSIEWRTTDEDFLLRQTGHKLVYGIHNHSNSKTIEARSMKDGTVKWTAQTHLDDVWRRQLTVTETMVLSTETTAENSIITAYHSKSGKQAWQHTSPRPVTGDLIVANKRLLFRSGNYRAGRIAALNVKTGEVAWTHDDPTLLFYNGPVVANGTAYFGGQYKPGSNFIPRWALVCAIDVKTGEREWSYLLKGLDDQSTIEPPAAGIPVVADGRLYTATFPGTSTTDWEYVRYANLVVFESTDQPPDDDHRLPDETDTEDKPPTHASKLRPILRRTLS